MSIRKRYFEILLMIIGLTMAVTWLMIVLNMFRGVFIPDIFTVVGAILSALYASLMLIYYHRYSEDRE